MRRTLLLAAYWVLSTGYSVPAADKPVPIRDAAARMTVPEGFRVTLFAGEPDIVQPIAFTFDDRGRMWVVECLSYPKWRHDGKGSDRVTILEDTDGDGTHDKKTVVLDNGSNLSGIELGFGGVWLCSVPNLLFIPIKDDKPAGPPQVVLDGWNIKDTKHNVFNGLAWGPDGWLYGCNGIQSKSWVGKPGTPQKDRVYMDCGVWRYHPTAKKFEVFAHGTTNPWGLDWDDYGQLFITNCVIDHLWHVVPGGHYQRMYGQDPNPFTFGLMGPASDHRHWGGGHWTAARADQKTGAVQKAHDVAGGGHAHSGTMVYLGDNFPADYRNSVFTCNIHGNRVNRDTLHRQGSGYVGRHAPDFLHANDPWFRGICIKYGPDGGVYVSDWCDTGECHNYDVADTSNGRIYKVTFGTPKPWTGDVAKMTDWELAKLQGHKNDWFVRQARRVLYERAAEGKKLEFVTRTWLTKQFEDDPNVPRKLRALWALHATGNLDDDRHAKLFAHENEFVRAWATLLAVEAPTAPPSAQPAPRPLGLPPWIASLPIPADPRYRWLVSLAARESSPFVRMHLAAAIQRVDVATNLELAAELFKRTEDNADPNLTLMYWFGVQPAALINPHGALDLSLQVKIGRVRENLVRAFFWQPRDVRELADWALALIGKAKDDETRIGILRGILAAVGDHKQIKAPDGWPQAYKLLDPRSSPELRGLTEELALVFGDERVSAAMRNRLTDRAHSNETRIRTITQLVARKTPDLAPLLRELLADPAVRGAAVRGLAAYPDPDTPAAVLKHYPAFTPAEKADAIQTLASRPAFAAALLDAIEKGTVPKADVTAFAARQIQALNDKAVSDKLARVWGTVQPASKTRAAQTARLKARLTPDVLRAADLANGRAVYAKTCAACHKLFGEGGDVGPELTGSQRANLDYVLENVLDPNAVVPGDYRMTAFYLADGRVVTGLVRKETPQAVTVRTANEEVLVPKADVEARKPTNHSVMPEGLLDPLKDDDIRDLIAYLASPKQVPPPK